MRHNKKVTFVLALLVVGVWGAIVYRIVGAVSGSEPGDVVVSEQGTSSPSAKASERYTYKDDVRDPFQFRIAPPKQRATSKDAASKPVWVEPPFKLVGIMQKEGAATAVLQRDDGATFFLQKGDTLSGVKIIKIEDELVQYSYQNQRRTWTLEK